MDDGDGRPGGAPTALPRRLLLAAMAAAAGAGTGVICSTGARQLDRPSFERHQGTPAPPGDDTARLNAMFARGGEIVVPADVYTVSVDESGACLVLDVPGTRVTFEPGTEIRLSPTRLGGYIVLSVRAADCAVHGGTIVGDLRRHAGSEGEWGQGVALLAGADRCILESVQAMECWGDGFYVSGGVVDVRLVQCTSEGNRRQGLSVVDAVRPHVVGGSYENTGRYGSTAPASGIDLEPNPGGAVVEARVSGVRMSGNKGQGLLVSARHGPVSAEISGCTASHNGDAGFLFDGPGTQLVLSDSESAANARGVALSRDSRGVVATDVVASGCSGPGYVVDGTGNQLTACVASSNGGSGFVVRATAEGTLLRACRGASNSVRGRVPDFDIAGPETLLLSARSSAGAGTPSSAVVVRSSAVGARVQGGAWTGPYATATVQDQRATTE